MDLSTLNAMQVQAVKHTDGPLLILAGAGSGKTRTLTHRAAQLIEQGVAPSQVLCLTFTNKAAQEMKERIEALLGSRAQGMWICTFHSMCMRILRYDGTQLGYTKSFTVYDADDQQRLVKQVMRALAVDEKKFVPRAVLAAISEAKNSMRTPGQMRADSGQDFFYGTVAQVYEAYERQLKDNNAMDFDDLLLNTVRLFEQFPETLARYQSRFRYVHVDEYQDTNRAQYLIVRMLASHQNLCVVGDDDQSIYGWRGADIQNILDFERDFPGATVIRLEQNYRSTQPILEASNEMIAHNRGRKGKRLWTQRVQGDPVVVHRAVSEREEATYVVSTIAKLLADYSLGDMAVLYRTNAQSRAVEEMLRHANLAYRMVGGTKFYDRKEIKDIIAYLRFLQNPNDSIALQRILNVPRRGIGETTVNHLLATAAASGVSLWEAICAAEGSQTVTKRAGQTLSAFSRDMIGLMAQGSLLMPLGYVKSVIETTGLLTQYQGDQSMEAQGRIENTMEFVNAIKDYFEDHPEETMEEYLSGIALVADIDSYDAQQNAITLMTLHSAKGLEFRVVFFVGLEEGLCPHSRSKDESSVEEERRLCYVGMTRAMDKLYLTYALSRGLYGATNHNPPSRFLKELPEGDGVLREDHQLVTPQQRVQQREEESFSRPRAGQPRMGVSRTPAPPPVTPNAQLMTLVKGDRVRHPAFGSGEVLSLTGTGQAVNAQIDFGDKGVKIIALRYAAMEKV